ncbi:AraC family transcriptional regulator [Rhodanobacter sp. 7MK24]|uniref:cupin domain-containing protein n=1 Tax=Rhodanobacter sp. 7MK24 TaxID=2775922 RepID=UPI001CE1B41F|nr:AraC family transcriptional regulator [Rhodanobacter sp. 7MK24]
MDALSKLIAVSGVQGSLDLRCRMAGSFALDHEQLEPGKAPFHLMLRGTAQLLLPKGEMLELHTGDFVLLPRGAAHVVQGTGHGASAEVGVDNDGPLPERSNTAGPVDMDLLCGHFSYGHGGAQLLMNTLPDALYVPMAELEGMALLDSIVTTLRREAARLDQGSLAITKALSEVLFVLALRRYISQEGLAPSLLGLLIDHRLSAVLLAMMKEPGRDWTVESLAHKANMSRATFARHFTEKADASPMDLLTSIRMQLACDLLLTGNLPVDAVAEQVGYQSVSAFIKTFQRRIGTSPASFRRHGAT